MSNSDKLARIRALFAKANAEGVTPHEAEALTDKAFELAAKYGIDAAVESKTVPGYVTEKREARKGEVGRPFHQMFALANIVHRFCDSGIVVVSKTEYLAHGFPTDLDRAELLLTSLLVQGMRQQVRDYNASGAKLDGERRSTYKRSWWNGYVSRLSQRFDEIKNAAVVATEATGTPGVALVLRDKKAELDEHIAAYHGKLRRNRSRGTTGSGYGAGKAAGDRADIGSKKLHGHQDAIGR